MDLGGDSLSAMQLSSLVQTHLQASVSVEQLLSGMTLPDLGHWIQQQGRDTPHHKPRAPQIARQSRNQLLPLSHSQRRMWLVQQFTPDTTAYHVPFALELKGTLDVDTLHRAVSLVWARHETFWTRFVETPLGPRQSIAPAPHAPLAWAHIDLGSASNDASPDAAARFLAQACLQPFDLSNGPLWRLYLVALSDRHHVLALIAHHILIDFAGNLIVAKEIAKAYSSLLNGEAPLLTPVHLDCADHAHWQTSPDVSAQLAPQLAYWAQEVKDLPPLNLPTDRPMARDWQRSGGRVTLPLPVELPSRLNELASQQGCTPFMIMIAALSLMIGRHARQSDVAIATPIANRHAADTANLVATLVNTLVVRTDLSGDPSFLTLLGRTKAKTLKAYENQDLPFDLLVEHLGQGTREDGLPLGLSVMLNVQNVALGQLEFAGLQTNAFLFDRGASQFPLSFRVDPEHSRTLSVEYADALFDHQTAEAIGENYLDLLRQVLNAPAQPLSHFAWHTKADRDTWHLGHRNAQPSEQDTAPQASTIHEQLNRAARQHPRKIAIRHRGRSHTYSEVQSEAFRIRERLRVRGIGPGSRVGILLERGPHMVSAIWGVMASGACYVPLDPLYPKSRLTDIAQDAELALLLTDASSGELLHDGSQTTLVLDPTKKTADGCPPQADEDPCVPPDAPAYLIYTSGSTGRPKGVCVPHQAVLNFLRSMSHTPGLSRLDRMLAVTTLSFDIAVLELLLPLTLGAQVVMAEQDDVHDGHRLRKLIDTERITIMQATPATWRMLLDAGWQGQGRRRFKALVGGETLPVDLAALLAKHSTELWNMYGPTETTVWSTCWRVPTNAATIRIGRPIDNTRVHVLDEAGHPCQVGIPGEICIAGKGVTQGYWRKPELTKDRFVPEPGIEAPPLPMYRTGDLGRWTWDGQLEHLGRIDQQIKIRGYRIEPGDVEACLLAHPSVKEAVLIAREDRPGDKRLVAYVVANEATLTNPPTLREHARQHLPAYMVPHHFVPVPRLPRLVNGKLDRDALPKPAPLSEGYVESSPISNGPIEHMLTDVWKAVLGTDDVRPQDNFFELGGHSLLAIQAIGLMADRTGIRVAPRDYIFNSLAQLATRYASESKITTTPTPQTESATGRPKGLLSRLLTGRRQNN